MDLSTFVLVIFLARGYAGGVAHIDMPSASTCLAAAEDAKTDRYTITAFCLNRDQYRFMKIPEKRGR